MGKNFSRSYSPTKMISKIFQFPQNISIQEGTTICSSSPNLFLYYYRIEELNMFQKFMNQLIIRRKYIYDNPKIKQYLSKINLIYVQKNELKKFCHNQALFSVYMSQSYDLKITLLQYFQQNNFCYNSILEIVEIIIKVMSEYQKNKIRNNPLNFDQIFVQNEGQNIKCIVRDPFIRNWKNNLQNLKRQSGSYKSDVYIFGNYIQKLIAKNQQKIRLSIKYGQSFAEDKSDDQVKSQIRINQLIKLMVCPTIQKRYNWLQLNQYIKSKSFKQIKKITQIKDESSIKLLKNIISVPTSESPKLQDKDKISRVSPPLSHIPLSHTLHQTVIKNNNQSLPSPYFPIDYTDLHTIGKNWQRFEGYLINGIKQGPGKIFLTNKHIFNGIFKNDVAQGPGKVIDLTGQILLTGNWSKNKLLTKYWTQNRVQTKF